MDSPPNSTWSSVHFVSNDQLQSLLATTPATEEQKAEALSVNTEARLWALNVGVLLMAAVSLLAILPAGRLPNYIEGEVPSPASTSESG